MSFTTSANSPRGCHAGALFLCVLLTSIAAPHLAIAQELRVPPANCVELEPPPRPLAPSEARPTITVDAKLSVSELIAVAGRAFNEEQYETALAYLAAAYTRSPLPSLLFNIAQTQRKAGYAPDALRSYQRFIELAPQSPLVPEATAHVAAMQAKIAAQQATQERAAAEQLAHERAAQAERLAKERKAEREQAQRELSQALAQKERPLHKRKWFWGLIGGLVVSTVAVGLGVGLSAQLRPEPVGQLPTQEPQF